jgi:hypothetical protein
MVDINVDEVLGLSNRLIAVWRTHATWLSKEIMPAAMAAVFARAVHISNWPEEEAIHVFKYFLALSKRRGIKRVSLS